MSNEEQPITVEYTECYLAFLDILGFSTLVDESTRNPDLFASLVGLINGLAEHETREMDPWRSMIFSRKDPATGVVRTWTLQVRAFSDSIVLFVPTATQGLSWLLGKIRYLHDAVVSLGYVMRGAVVINGMYWDDSWSEIIPRSTEEVAAKRGCLHSLCGPRKDAREPVQESCDKVKTAAFITLGPAMVEAYNLENKVAIYPRILMSEDLFAHVTTIAQAPPEHSLQMADARNKTFPLTTGNTSTNTLTLLDFIREDEDKCHFFHVLSEHIHRSDEGTPVMEKTLNGGTKFVILRHDPITHEDWMKRIREFLEQKLVEHKGGACFAKYSWFARYYNQSLGALSLPQLDIE